MSLEQLKAFLAKTKGDSNLQEKLKAARSPEDVVGIAKKHGHEFTVDVSKNAIIELYEDELERVSCGVNSAVGLGGAAGAVCLTCGKASCPG